MSGRRASILALLSLILRLSVGGILVYAALPKLAHPDQFADIITDYRILPAALVPWLALTLPWLELITGTLLILGVATRAAAYLTTAMFVVFTAALVSAEARDLDIACGCFDVAAESGKTTESLWVSVLLVVSGIALVVLADDGERFSLSRLLRWPAGGRRRAVVAVLIALAAILVDAVMVSAMRRDEGSAANTGAKDVGTVTFLARRELGSDQLLGPYKTVHPQLTVELNPQAGTADNVLAILAGGPHPDVIEVGLDQVPWLVDQGVLQPLDTARLPDWGQLAPFFTGFPGLTVGGRTYAAPVDGMAVGIIYRRDRLTTAPTSFKDLFGKRFKRKAAIMDDATVGIRMGAAALGWGQSRELSQRQLGAIVRFLRTDAPHIYSYYRDGTDLESLFRAGVVDIAAGDKATAERLSAAGVPVGFAAPKEGLLFRARGLAISAASRDIDDSYGLVGHYLSAPVQALDADLWGYTVSNQTVAGSAAPNLGTPDSRVILVTPPSAWPAWNEAWRRVILPGHG